MRFTCCSGRSPEVAFETEVIVASDTIFEPEVSMVREGPVIDLSVSVCERGIEIVKTVLIAAADSDVTGVETIIRKSPRLLCSSVQFFQKTNYIGEDMWL